VTPLAGSGEPGAYARAGVDIDRAAHTIERIKELARGAARPEVLSGVGFFAGMFRLGTYREPVLVASTDSVGTKVKIAALLERYDSVGVDVVNQSVNDILCSGAEPLFFLDYIASSSLSEDAKLAMVRGVVTACRAAGCALLGGETADMPDVYAPGDFDLVGFIVGAVERDAIIDGSRIAPGDALLALPSSGLHTNGYSLVRRIFSVGVGGDPDEERARLYRNYPGLGVTLGEALLTPHRSYVNELRPHLGIIKGIAHITGGGIVDNVPRMLPEGLAARIDRSAWRVPPLFHLIQSEGGVTDEEMFRVFNMGLGIVFAVAPGDVATLTSALREARVVGEVVRHEGGPRVMLT
jgi:phosphoribosylformylglycinamidine cyclo-ligase